MQGWRVCPGGLEREGTALSFQDECFKGFECFQLGSKPVIIDMYIYTSNAKGRQWWIEGIYWII